MSFQQFRDEKRFIHTSVCWNILSTIYLETDFVWVAVNVLRKAVSGISNGDRWTWSDGWAVVDQEDPKKVPPMFLQCILKGLIYIGTALFLHFQPNW